MKKNILALSIAALVLAACGGGGSGTSTTAPATAAQTSSTTPPAVSPTATLLAAANISLTTSGGDYLVKYAGVTSASLVISGATVTFSDNQAAGEIKIIGSGNKIVFRPGVTAASVVIGSGNTIYIPVGSSIKLDASVTAGSTVINYTP